MPDLEALRHNPERLKRTLLTPEQLEEGRRVMAETEERLQKMPPRT